LQRTENISIRKKEQLLTEQMGVKEAVTRALRSVSGLAQIEEDTMEIKWRSSLKLFSSFKQEWQN
jgi:hypothetical protein